MASIIKSDNGVSSGITGIVQSADSSGQLALQTTTSSGTATTAVTIDNTQKVTFANSIGFGSNAGITFNNSSALTNSTLNDYETGTWTPNQGSGLTVTGTFGSSGTYTKIGRIVYVSGVFTASTLSASPYGLLCTNLPFVTLNGNNSGTAFPNNNSTIYGVQFGASTNMYLNGTISAAANAVYFSGSYQATF